MRGPSVDSFARPLWGLLVALIAASCGKEPEPSSPEPISVKPSSPEPISEKPSSPAPAQVKRIDARTVLVDDRFEVTGSGTVEDPYRIDWVLLVSGAETFVADAPMDSLPARLFLFHDMWVEIDGYLAAPLVVDITSELLVMKNKWDGCCLGLPPTPFDSLEAALTQPLVWKGKHLFRSGRVKGVLKVDPFQVGGFLMGLYRLEQASLEGA